MIVTFLDKRGLSLIIIYKYKFANSRIGFNARIARYFDDNIKYEINANCHRFKLKYYLN